MVGHRPSTSRWWAEGPPPSCELRGRFPPSAQTRKQVVGKWRDTAPRQVGGGPKALHLLVSCGGGSRHWPNNHARTIFPSKTWPVGLNSRAGMLSGRVSGSNWADCGRKGSFFSSPEGPRLLSGRVSDSTGPSAGAMGAVDIRPTADCKDLDAERAGCQTPSPFSSPDATGLLGHPTLSVCACTWGCPGTRAHSQRAGCLSSRQAPGLLGGQGV